MDLESPTDRVWDVIEKVGICMLTTRAADGRLRARPMEARPDRSADALYYLTDIRGLKDDEVAHDQVICAVFVDPSANLYLSVSGQASVYRDPQKAAEIWQRTDDVWWPGGADDPNVRILKVEPERAELWDGPASKAVAAFEFAKARVTGQKPNLGENRKVTVPMR